MQILIVKRLKRVESLGIEKLQNLSWGALGVQVKQNSIEGKEISFQQVINASSDLIDLIGGVA